MRGRRHLKIEDLTFLIDTREQNPFDFSIIDKRIKTAPASLPTADYTIRGLEEFIAIERKSLPDLIGCIGSQRDRFEREIKRLQSYPCRAVIVEGAWNELAAGDYRAKISPQAATGSVLGWIEKGIHFFFAQTRTEATKYAAQLMWISAHRRFKELQALGESLRLLDEITETSHTESAQSC